MNFHISLPEALIGIVLWWIFLGALTWALTRWMSRDVTPAATRRSRHLSRDPGPLDRATEALRERTWRRCGRLLWLTAGQLSGRRALRVRRWSTRCTQRGALLELRRRRRENAAAVLDAQARAWARTLDSSRSSATILPPAAPRPAPVLPWISPDMNPSPPDESTRRWERTLPWGTPSPLMTREGRGKPYPFVPLAPPLPSSSRRARRNP